MSHPQDPVAPHSCAAGERLRQQLLDDRLDVAIEEGLMQFDPCAACSPQVALVLRDAQEKLRRAWEARDRHFARKARLAARAEARAAERSPGQGTTSGLPSAAAAALARARARAGSKGRGGA